MSANERREEAVEMLQELGLKEYEAKCFVALTRVPKATAKEISNVADVPRTRVYDANRILESKGLVEVQHANPQQFRAVAISEAMETLRQQYESRMESLQETLRSIEPAETSVEPVSNEVWALSEKTAIQNRTMRLLESADSEVVLVVGSADVMTEPLYTTLETVTGDDTTLVIGALTTAIKQTIQTKLPDAEVFVSTLDWLEDSRDDGETATLAVGRLLLVDREAILVSTFDPTTSSEHAVFGRGFGNGLVVILRRLLTTGLLQDTVNAGE